MSAPRHQPATILPAPVSRCTAAQEMAEALRVLQQIAARIDSAKLPSFGQAKEKPSTGGNERV